MSLVDELTGRVSGSLREPLRVEAAAGNFFMVLELDPNAAQVKGVHAIDKSGTFTLDVAEVPRVGHAPRAKTTNLRTREHMRRWGIADKLRALSPLGIDYPSNVLFVTGRT